jgi:hypothetical protein
MSSGRERVIRVRRLRIVADELIVEPGRILIKRPGKEKKEREEGGFRGEVHE